MTTRISQAMLNGATAIGLALISASSAAAARSVLELSSSTALPPGHITGLEGSNDATDATNDIVVSAGTCRDSTNTANLTIASTITKRLDAAWAVGSGNGGRDTGSIADGWWHVYAIYRPDTQVTDVLFSLSPTAPTLPTNYTLFRRLFSVLRASGALVGFKQYGDVFKWDTQRVDRTGTGAVANSLLTLSVPTGFNVMPLFVADMLLSGAGDAIMLMSDGVALAAVSSVCRTNLASQNVVNVVSGLFVTNTSAQVRFEQIINSGMLSSARIQTQGWIDRRGK